MGVHCPVVLYVVAQLLLIPIATFFALWIQIERVQFVDRSSTKNAWDLQIGTCLGKTKNAPRHSNPTWHISAVVIARIVRGTKSYRFFCSARLHE